MATPPLTWDEIGSIPAAPGGSPEPEQLGSDAALALGRPDGKGRSAAPEDGWPTLSEAALYGWAGEVTRTIGPHSEADSAALLISTLVAAGNLLGPGIHCSVEASRHGLNLYAVLVGESSKARKGTSWAHIDRLCARVDQVWTNDRVTGGLSSAEGLILEVRDNVEPPEPPPDRRLLLMQSEFSSVLRVMTRDGNTLSPVLRDAWDSGRLRTLVKNNPLRATGAHISKIGHITRPELLRYLSDTEHHNGFANRILWCCVRRSKFLPEGGRVPSAEMDALADRLREIVAWARSEERELRRDAAARGLWAAIYPQLSAGLPGLLGAATGRAEAQVLRLSSLYAALDRSTTVRVDHLRAALSLWDYCFASARYIFGDATGNPIADRIREALRDAGEEGLTRTEISKLFGRHASSDRIGQALSELAAMGGVRRRVERGEGRSTEIWIAK